MQQAGQTGQNKQCSTAYTAQVSHASAAGLQQEYAQQQGMQQPGFGAQQAAMGMQPQQQQQAFPAAPGWQQQPGQGMAAGGVMPSAAGSPVVDQRYVATSEQVFLLKQKVISMSGALAAWVCALHLCDGKESQVCVQATTFPSSASRTRP